MRTFIVTVLLLLGSSALAAWPQQIECDPVSPTVDLQHVSMSIPSKLSTDGITPGAMMTIVAPGQQPVQAAAMVTEATANELAVMSQQGFACVISDVQGEMKGSCGIVAGDHQDQVNCR